MLIKEIYKLFDNKLEIRPKSKASNVLRDISSFLTKPGLINIEVKDLNKIILSSDKMFAISAKAHGKERAHKLGRQIVSSIPAVFRAKKATNVIFNIIGSSDLTLWEVNEVAGYIYDAIDPHANIIFGALIDDKKKDFINATVIFGGN